MKQNICSYCNIAEIQPRNLFCDDCNRFITKRFMMEQHDLGMSDYLLNLDHYEASPEISIDGIWGYHGELKINEV